MPNPFKTQFMATNPKSQHLDIPNFIIGRQSTQTKGSVKKWAIIISFEDFYKAKICMKNNHISSMHCKNNSNM